MRLHEVHTDDTRPPPSPAGIKWNGSFRGLGVGGAGRGAGRAAGKFKQLAKSDVTPAAGIHLREKEAMTLVSTAL